MGWSGKAPRLHVSQEQNGSAFPLCPHADSRLTSARILPNMAGLLSLRAAHDRSNRFPLPDR
jgi:hypothetical protein